MAERDERNPDARRAEPRAPERPDGGQEGGDARTDAPRKDGGGDDERVPDASRFMFDDLDLDDAD